MIKVGPYQVSLKELSHEDPHLSFTQVKMYQRCPQQWYYRYVEGLILPPDGSLALGKATHQTIAQSLYHKKEKGQALPEPDLLDGFRTNMQRILDEGVELEEGEKEAQLISDGIGVLRVWNVKAVPLLDPLGVETKFGMQIQNRDDSVDLLGYIDLSTKDARVVDHKTAKRAPDALEATGSFQLSAYALGHQLLYQEPSAGQELHVLIRGREPRLEILRTVRGLSRLETFLQTTILVARSMKAGIVYPSPDVIKCRMCGYRRMCPAYGGDL